MKLCYAKIGCVVLLALMIAFLMSGCGASTDAFARGKLQLELFPNTETHAGKGSTEIAKQVNKSNVVRTAMAEDVVKNPEDLTATMTAMGF